MTSSRQTGAGEGALRSPPFISLIVGSVGRIVVLERLLESLSRQTFENYEVLLVEQSGLEKTQALVDRFSHLRIRVIPSNPGLARARNVGLSAVSGHLVGFPDDDCWYHPTTLQTLVDQFVRASPKLGVIAARVTTSSGEMIRFPDASEPISSRNVWKTVVSPGLFVTKAACDDVNGFDVGLGVGAGTPFGSGEETDLVLRVLDVGWQARFEPSIRVFHPSPADVRGRLDPQLGRSYGRGMGVVMRHHALGTRSAGVSVLRPAIGAFAAGSRGDWALARFRLAVSQGRVEGYSKGRQLSSSSDTEAGYPDRYQIQRMRDPSQGRSVLRTAEMIRADWGVNGWRGRISLLLFRLASLPSLGRVGRGLVRGAYIVLVAWFFRIELPVGTQVGPGLRLRQARGVLVHRGSVIGCDCELNQGCTIGPRGHEGGTPRVGDRAVLGKSCHVLGDIDVGNDVEISAGAVVFVDVPDSHVAVGNPARVLARH